MINNNDEKYNDISKKVYILIDLLSDRSPPASFT